MEKMIGTWREEGREGREEGNEKREGGREGEEREDYTNFR